jgi:hypothetical protein
MAEVALLLAQMAAILHLAWFQPLLLAVAVVELMVMEVVLLEVLVAVRHGLLVTTQVLAHRDKVTLAEKTQHLEVLKAEVEVVALVQ